jgi:hypothetical protein
MFIRAGKLAREWAQAEAIFFNKLLKTILRRKNF